MTDLNVESIIYYRHNATDYVKMHSHEMYECVFYKTGKGHSSTQGENVDFKPNSLIVIPPHIEHDEYTEIESEVYIVCFTCSSFFESNITCFNFNETTGSKVSGLFEEMIEEQKKSSDSTKSIINSLFSSILLLAESSKIKKVNSLDYSSLIESVKNFIKENYSMNIDFSKIAPASGYSYSRFRHIFSNYAGTSLHQYLLNCRLDKSKKLLIETDYKITKIKDLCGFKTNDQFCVFFKKEIGLTPLEFREYAKKENDMNVVNFKDNKDRIEQNFIIDTDLDADCDDVGALALADILTKQKYGKLLCVTHCVGHIEATRNIASINKYYGVKVPIGMYKGSPIVPFANKYVDEVNKRFPSEEAEFEDSIRLLRRTLANSKDNSVTFISIGQFSNLERLRTSLPDDISPLSGDELMERKLTRIVSMAGLFYDSTYSKSNYNDNNVGEYNIYSDLADARSFIDNNNKIPHYFADFFTGYDLVTLDEFVSKYKFANPVSTAYYLFSNGKGRQSWDLITILYAFLSTNKAFSLIGPGKVKLDKNGVTSFVPNEKGNNFYIRINNKDYIKNYINTLMMKQEMKK